jgi:hypothetical protein
VIVTDAATHLSIFTMSDNAVLVVDRRQAGSA